jgi:DNA-directed RNA polymerase specialized sigma24 family protein
VPAQTGRESAPGQGRRPSASGDIGMFAAMFDEHARHVFDYCLAILTDQFEAARATEATFITAYSLIRWLRDHDRIRPWLFALARNECTSSYPGRAELAAFPELSGRSDLRHAPPAGYMGEPDTVELRRAFVEAHRRLMEGIQAMGSLAEDPQREAAVLVYRHRISPAELPAILGIPAKQAEALLAAALAGARAAQHPAKKTSISQSRPQRPATGSDDSVDAAHLGALAIPLAVLPPDIWWRAARVAIDPQFRRCRDAVVDCAGQLRFDGFPADSAASGAKARARLRLVAMATVPVVAAVAAFLYFGHSPAPSGGPSPASETLQTSGTGLGSLAPASPAPSSHGPSTTRSPGNSGDVTLPVPPAPTGPAAPSTSGKPKPSPSSTPTAKGSSSPTTTPPTSSSPPPTSSASPTTPTSSPPAPGP